MMIHGANQPFETAFQHVLQAVQIGRLLHTGLQVANMFAQLMVQLPRCRLLIGMVFAGCQQATLERLKALIELLEIGLKLMLSAVIDGEHQHGEIVEDR